MTKYPKKTSNVMNELRSQKTSPLGSEADPSKFVTSHVNKRTKTEPSTKEPE
jgi:hypothetical protein